MGTNPGLRLRLSAEPESIGAARAAVAALAEKLGIGEATLMDLKVIVSEACTNVVRHAYPDGQGVFEVEAVHDGNGLRVTVTDFGQGIRPRMRTGGDSLQLGFGLMSMLSSHFEIDGGDPLGTRVTLEVPLDG